VPRRTVKKSFTGDFAMTAYSKKGKKGSKKGFTLVEILIVVIILGILAAIVIPQFTNASTDARNNSTTSLLQTMRSQIELYKLQHGDTLPDIITNWAPLTNTSLSTDGSTVGPYLQTTPRNPQNGLSTVGNGLGNAAVTNVGFIYDYSGGTGTGKIVATSSTDNSTPYPG
jgi:general secretion pathway protein G